MADELSDELNAAKERWEALEKLVLEAGAHLAHDAVSVLDEDDLRFMVLERLLRETQQARLRREA